LGDIILQRKQRSKTNILCWRFRYFVSDFFELLAPEKSGKKVIAECLTLIGCDPKENSHNQV